MFISDNAPIRQTSPNQGNGRSKCPHRRRPSLAFALALTALVVALSSGAYAANTAQRNSVVSKSIKNGHVRAPDLAADVITSDKIADATIRGADLTTDVITSDKIADATILGADLDEGSVSAGNLGTIETYSAVSPLTGDADGIPNGGDHAVTYATALCPAAGVPISGGATWTGPDSATEAENFYLQATRRVAGGWMAIGIVDMGSQGTIRLQAHVDCLMPAGYVAD